MKGGWINTMVDGRGSDFIWRDKSPYLWPGGGISQIIRIIYHACIHFVGFLVFSYLLMLILSTLLKLISA